MNERYFIFQNIILNKAKINLFILIKICISIGMLRDLETSFIYSIYKSKESYLYSQLISIFAILLHNQVLRAYT